MADFILRPAVREDFPAIRTLINVVQINPLGLDWRRFQVAVSLQRELLACGQIKPHKDGSLELASIAVIERVRGTGIARAIIETLLRNENKRPIYLMCRSKLSKLYNKFAFYEINHNEMPLYFRRIHSAAIFFNRNLIPEDHLIVMRLD